VEDLDQHLLLLLPENFACTVMRIDDAVADLELDMGGRFSRLKIIQLLFR
jgi:hypothetical protein